MEITINGNGNVGAEPVTDREALALEYLSDKLGSTAQFVGRYVWNNAQVKNGSNLSALGAAVLGRLRKHGLVTQLEGGMWRITDLGRQSIARR